MPVLRDTIGLFFRANRSNGSSLRVPIHRFECLLRTIRGDEHPPEEVENRVMSRLQDLESPRFEFRREKPNDSGGKTERRRVVRGKEVERILIVWDTKDLELREFAIADRGLK